MTRRSAGWVMRSKTNVVAGSVVGAELERDHAEDDATPRTAMPIRPFAPKDRKYWSRSWPDARPAPMMT